MDVDMRAEVNIEIALKNMKRTINLFKDSIETNVDFVTEAERRSSDLELHVDQCNKALLTLLSNKFGLKLNIEQLTVSDGVYYYQEFPLVLHFNFLRNGKQEQVNDEYLMSPLGYVLEVTHSNILTYCTTAALVSGYQDLCTKKITHSDLPTWVAIQVS